MTMITGPGPNNNVMSRDVARQLLTNAVSTLKGRIAALGKWQAENAAIAELAAKSDRELKDMGLYRSEISRVVRIGRSSRLWLHGSRR